MYPRHNPSRNARIAPNLAPERTTCTAGLYLPRDLRRRIVVDCTRAEPQRTLCDTLRCGSVGPAWADRSLRLHGAAHRPERGALPGNRRALLLYALQCRRVRLVRASGSRVPRRLACWSVAR